VLRPSVVVNQRRRPRSDRVVPFAVEGMREEVDSAHVVVGDRDARRVLSRVEVGVHLEAAASSRGSDQIDHDLVTGEGRPRQFMLMCEKTLCSILFHLLVPGGR
jgi:hypothetical protein